MRDLDILPGERVSLDLDLLFGEPYVWIEYGGNTIGAPRWLVLAGLTEDMEC